MANRRVGLARPVPVVVCAIVVGAALLTVPLATESRAGPSIVAGPSCILAGDPVDEIPRPGTAPPAEPLELNTVVVGALVKSVAMEKEVFYCRRDGQPNTQVDRIVDAETFVELVERGSRNAAGRPQVLPVEKRVEIAFCIKDLPGTGGGTTQEGSVTCKTQDVPLEPMASPFAGCRATGFPQPSDPVEMNTVALSIGTTPLVRTVKVEKEIFSCLIPNTFERAVVDLYLFTEIVEQGVRDPIVGPTLRPTSNTFEAILCRKQLAPLPEGGTDFLPAIVRCTLLPT